VTGIAIASSSAASTSIALRRPAVLISQVAAIGPTVKGLINFPTNNEFVELYNPGYGTVAVGGLRLHYRSTAQGTKSLYSVLPTGVCINSSNQACQGAQKCSCQGTLTTCTSNNDCTEATIGPKGYLLVVPQTHDPALPKEDYLHTANWQMDSGKGAIELIRVDGSKFPGGSTISDLVCWGGSTWAGCPKQVNQPTFDSSKPNCSLVRKPRQCTTAKKVSDPQHADHYSGNGYTSKQTSSADWFRYCPREARNSSHPPQKP